MRTRQKSQNRKFSEKSRGHPYYSSDEGAWLLQADSTFSWDESNSDENEVNDWVLVNGPVTAKSESNNPECPPLGGWTSDDMQLTLEENKEKLPGTVSCQFYVHLGAREHFFFLITVVCQLLIKILCY